MAHPFVRVAKQFNTQMKEDIKNGHIWRYSNSNNKTTFDRARSTGAYCVNCVRMLCWILRAVGVLHKGESFYSCKGRLVWSKPEAKTSLEEKCDIIPVNGKKVRDLIASKELQPGDICCYLSISHTNMYAGNGKFYDSGHAYCKEQGEWARFITWYGGAVHSEQTLSHIIRLKETAKQYRVQCGAYFTREKAKAKVKEMKAAGFEAKVEKYGLRYIAQAGKFINKANADVLKEKLVNCGLTSKIIIC